MSAAAASSFAALPTAAKVAIVVLAVVEVVLFVVGLLVWSRTEADRLPGGNRWLWFAMLFITLIGPIALLVARKPAPSADQIARPTRSAAATADLLYGDDDVSCG
mgnify:CR=1 FL=1